MASQLDGASPEGFALLIGEGDVGGSSLGDGVGAGVGLGGGLGASILGLLREKVREGSDGERVIFKLLIVSTTLDVP